MKTTNTAVQVMSFKTEYTAVCQTEEHFPNIEQIMDRTRPDSATHKRRSQIIASNSRYWPLSRSWSLVQPSPLLRSYSVQAKGNMYRRKGEGIRSFLPNPWPNSNRGSDLPHENRQTGRISEWILRSRRGGEIGHLRRPPPVAGAEEVDEKRRWVDTVTGQTVGVRWQGLRCMAALERSSAGLLDSSREATHLHRLGLGHSGLFAFLRNWDISGTASLGTTLADFL